ncbi:oligopeptide transporter 5 [Phtheirospermum japonicum]|uniref:Oligopeptide transporter 5 n=1 Tax=Phtheirospermum japonicum TaxID=374723 RepID=A0A830C5M9_9LAMI|nr:oligopeptide transporter 5 [Phtheirospermum japonicum]
MFGNLGLYPEMNYFFLIGLLAPLPVWYISRRYPEKKWIKFINVPILISGAGSMPVAKAVNYMCWFSVECFSTCMCTRGIGGGGPGIIIFCRLHWMPGLRLWPRCVISRCSLMGLVGRGGGGWRWTITVRWQSGPMARGIRVEGCPVFY